MEQNSRRLSYEGDGTALAVLMLKNILLTILTFGIYTPWARTAFRRHVWGRIIFDGDRLQYTGTGKELFKGYMKVGLMFLAIGIVSQVGKILFPMTFLFVSTLVIPTIYICLFSVIVYSGYRYRLSRSNWRQIRFGVHRDKQEARQFMKLYIKGSIFTALTLGFYYPYFRHNIISFLTKHSRIGDQDFDYTGDATEFRNIFYKGWILTLLTLGFYFPWFRLNLAAYRLTHTRIMGANASTNLTGGALFKYTFGSFLLLLVTVGIALPWIVNWGLCLLVDSLSIDGSFDPSLIKNAPSEGSATGDSLLDAFDIDIGL